MNILYWALPISLFGSLILINVAGGSESVRMGAGRWVFSALVAIYLAKMVWMLFIFIDDIVRFVRFLSSASDKPNEDMLSKMNRSEFLVSAGLISAGALFGSFIYGVWRGAHNYKVRRRELVIDDLPEGLEGMKILQISDVHSGSFWSPEAVKEGIDKIVEEAADMIFFTGDLVNNESREFDPFVEEFSRISAPLGVYSILGNHDYGDYGSWPDANGLSKEENLNRLKEHHSNVGWKLLLNEHVKINHNGEEFAVIGVENWSNKMNFTRYGDLDKAYAGSENARIKFLLSHDPSHWRAEIVERFKDIQATFSGHTHGMQFGVNTKYYKWSPVKYVYNEWQGFYKEGKQQLYVNTGFGYLGYPGRLGFYPEITVFELKRA